jgi:hypothetical protein
VILETVVIALANGLMWLHVFLAQEGFRAHDMAVALVCGACALAIFTVLSVLGAVVIEPGTGIRCCRGGHFAAGGRPDRARA